MATVQGVRRTSSATPAVSYPAPPVSCRVFAWCASRGPGHSVHESAPVPLTGGDERLLFAETDPATGGLLYGPVLGGGDADEPVGHARVLAARLRVAAARLDELATAAEYGVSTKESQ